MYYRRGFYPRAGQADVPDDLWAEFQKIRGNLSNLDQNNVDSKTLQMETLVPPTDPDHNGVSDIIGEDEGFLYKSVGNQSVTVIPANNQFPDIWSYNAALSPGRWRDLGSYGLTLRAQSRGDTPWVVGVSIDACVYHSLEQKPPGSGIYKDVTDGSLMFSTHHAGHVPSGHGLAGAWPGGPTHKSDRANLRLRIKSSQDGLSTAEGVGGFNKYVYGSSIAAVSTVLSSGGPIEFSPSVHYTELYRSPATPKWGVRIVHANIFAFALNN